MIQIKKIHKNAVMPEYKTEGAVGFDLSLCKDTWFMPGKYELAETGLIIKPPDGYFIMVVPRSSTFKRYGLLMPHSVGIIDPDYCGDKDEIKLQFFNLLRSRIIVKAGVPIAQGILLPAVTDKILEVDNSFREESRGGYGSTDG